MKSSFHGMRTRALGALAGASAAFWGASAWASDRIGEPTPGAIDLQPGVTDLRNQAIWFHDIILLPIITIITLFVLGLLVWVVIRYNKRANPVPAKWSHNTAIEVAWTLIPVLILVVISIFSFRLLFDYTDMPKPDEKVGEFISNILPEAQANAKGVPYRLAATEPLVVPVNAVVRVQVTGADVIHAFAVPSFGIIADAVPGRLNETWFKANRIGTYYGNCRELCGVEHAFMPIEVKVVSQADFDAWVAKKGGSVGGATPAPVEAAPAAAAVATPAAATVAAATPEPKAGGTPAGTPAPSAPAAK